jgi:hypothetical protein
MSKNNFSCLSNANFKDVPSIIKIALFVLLNFYSSYYNVYGSSASFIIYSFYWLLLIPAEIAIHIAVSNLSPVSIHIFIPAFFKDSKV